MGLGKTPVFTWFDTGYAGGLDKGLMMSIGAGWLPQLRQRCADLGAPAMVTGPGSAGRGGGLSRGGGEPAEQAAAGRGTREPVQDEPYQPRPVRRLAVTGQVTIRANGQDQGKGQRQQPPLCT